MTTQSPNTVFAFDAPAQAVDAMLDRLESLGIERIGLKDATGRVLGESVQTDRPSPACDVSAMDGYAVPSAPGSDVPSSLETRNSTASTAAQPLKPETPPPAPGRSLPVVGEVLIGQPPPAMPSDAALRIFTGGPVPRGCYAVIPREQVEERTDAIHLPPDLIVKPGQHIRRCGENGQAGEIIVGQGTAITPNVIAALSACGIAEPRVYQRIRLAAIVTGNEVHQVSSDVEPWQLRDSNGPPLAALFAALPWVDWRGVDHALDERDRLRQTIAAALADCDALLLTGGVSMGDYDFVPAILAELGCEIVFHQLPIRPGKPVLGAIGSAGQAVLGLPGNPVSVLTTARRIALPMLRRRAGFAKADPPVPTVTLVNPDGERLALHWSRLVRLTGQGQAELIDTRGSGDIISAARSDGFIEVPANHVGPGPWPFYRWRASDE